MLMFKVCFTEHRFQLTFDPEPGVTDEITGLVFGPALEHGGVVQLEEVDFQRVVPRIFSGVGFVPEVRNLADGHPVAIPGHFRVRDAPDVTG